MIKPNGYDEAQASGSNSAALGGHYAVIKQVAEKKSSTGKDMVVVLFDFAAPDKQVGMFTERFNNDDRAEKKWPFDGSKYIMVMDYADSTKTSKDFKTFCTCVERSNAGFSITWGGSNWAAQFKGKRIGVVYGEEESEYEGEIRIRAIPRWFCEHDKAEQQRIPTIKKLRNRTGGGTLSTAPGPAADGFISVPEGVSDEIPF